MTSLAVVRLPNCCLQILTVGVVASSNLAAAPGLAVGHFPSCFPQTLTTVAAVQTRFAEAVMGPD
jgi:hypothetical protein